MATASTHFGYNLDRNNPAFTYTLSDFADLSNKDETTYRKLSIIDIENGIEFIDHNLFDEYMELIEPLAVDVDLTDDEFIRYRYAPDLVAYDVYNSVQLDYFVLALNNMVDPKEFDKRKIKLIKASFLSEIVNEIIKTNTGYLQQNRRDNGLQPDF